MEKNIIFDDLRVRENYDIVCSSGIGCRESQQDAGYVAANDEAVFAVVCDGMGGISGGQLASGTAVEAFIEYYQYYAQNDADSFECQWFQSAVEVVDDIVYSLADSNGKRIGAGTTLVGISILQNQLFWISVGDSRIYIFRKNEMVQVTNDHNYFLMLNQQLENNEISQEQYQKEVQKGEALISFIGMGGLLLKDVNQDAFLLQSGDVVLICTDGLYRTVEEENIKNILEQSKSMMEASQYFEYIIQGRNLPYQDNYTYVLIKKV